MLFSELFKIMVKIVTFVTFRGGDRLNRLPPGSAPGCSFECVLLQYLNAQPYIFAVVNCADIALSVFYSPAITICRMFLRL